MPDQPINNPAPEGYSTICPYLLVNNVQQELDFIQQVFGGIIHETLKGEDDQVVHGEIKIGDTMIMMGLARPEYPAIPSMNYVWVDDVDQTYQNALKQGATSLQEPILQFYGNREAGFADPQGIQWFVAKQVEVISGEQMQERMQQKT